MNTGFLISGYIPTTLGASNAIEMNSSKVIIEYIPVQNDKNKFTRIIFHIFYANTKELQLQLHVVHNDLRNARREKSSFSNSIYGEVRL